MINRIVCFFSHQWKANISAPDSCKQIRICLRCNKEETTGESKHEWSLEEDELFPDMIINVVWRTGSYRCQRCGMIERFWPNKLIVVEGRNKPGNPP